MSQREHEDAQDEAVIRAKTERELAHQAKMEKELAKLIEPVLKLLQDRSRN